MKVNNFIFILIFVATVLTGCKAVWPVENTNVGMAWDRAWYGVDPEIVEAVQFVDERMNKTLRDEYNAISSARVTDSNGNVIVEAAENRFRDMAIVNEEIEQWRSLSKSLSEYLGVSLKDDPNEDVRRADEARRKFWKNLRKAAKEAIEDINE